MVFYIKAIKKGTIKKWPLRERLFLVRELGCFFSFKVSKMQSFKDAEFQSYRVSENF
jgi:hypothetical protein